jgi:tetratricopeptide (TPR) repeat protein
VERGLDRRCTGLHRVYGVMHLRCTGLHRVYGVMHLRCTGLHRAYGAMHLLRTRLHRAYEAMHRRCMGLHRAYGAMHPRCTGLYRAYWAAAAPEGDSVRGFGMDWHLLLGIATGLFLLVTIWRFRPAFANRVLRPRRGALREAKQRIEAAKTPEERALALCEAGDACAYSLGRTTSAIGYYLRAMRANPASSEIVERAAKGLARRPYALESLLWRRLGAEPWTGDARRAAEAALVHLGALYAGPLHQSTRARALGYALAVMRGAAA